jgi:hypothetical protein
MSGDARKARLSRVQQEVMAYALKRGALGFTDEQLAQAFYTQQSTHRTRRAELCAKGLIIDSGRRRGETGRKHTIWVHADYAAN